MGQLDDLLASVRNRPADGAPGYMTLLAGEGSPIGFQAGQQAVSKVVANGLSSNAQLQQAHDRSGEIQDYLARQKDLSNGLDANTNAALKTKAMGEVQGAESGTLTALRGQQGSNGIRGGTAVAQNMATVNQAAKNVGDFTNQQTIANAQLKQQGLQNYGDAITKQEATEYGQLKDQVAAKLAGGAIGNANAASIAQLVSNDRSSAAQASANSGGSVICTSLYVQGIMPVDVYFLDSLYGDTVVKPAVRRGYVFLASPIARRMRTSKRLTTLVAPLAMAWANNMAAKLNPNVGRRNILGEAIEVLFSPICALVGLMIAKRK